MKSALKTALFNRKAAKVVELPELKARAADLYNEIEKRIEEDSKALTQLANRRETAILEHEKAIRQLMESHAAQMDILSIDEATIRDAINGAQIMKAQLAKIV